MMKSNLLLIVLFFSSTLVLHSCAKSAVIATKSENESEPEHHVQLPTTIVRITSVQRRLNFPGKVVSLPDHSVSVTPNIMGKISKVLVVPGQKVDKGQLIALLDDTQLQAQLKQSSAPQRAALNGVAQATIALDLAEKNLARADALFQKDVVAEKDVVTARSQVELAKSQVEAAQAKVEESRIAPLDLATQLAFTKVISPISGIVAQRFLNVGDLTDQSKPIAHIINLSTVIIDANMPADSPADPQVKQTAYITTVAEPGIKYDARITAISPVVDSAKNTVSIQLICPNRHSRLKEGQQVTVSIATNSSNAVLVPQAALVPGADDPSEHLVYVVRKGKLEQTKVIVGEKQNEMIAVFEGLNEGDEIISSDAYGVPDGAILDRGKKDK